MKIIKYTETLNEGVKRGNLTTLVVKMGDKRFFNREASNTFVEVIESISKSVGIEKFINDCIGNTVGRKFIGLKESEFPVYVRNIKKNSTGQFLINTHQSTSEKKIIIDSLFNFFDIEGSVEIRDRVEKSISSDNSKIDSDSTKEVQSVPDDEVDDVVEKIKVYQQNPFKQAICVLGESGAGKSVTVETILENEQHEFEFIIPTAATTGLLAQFSPSKSTYVPSRLGRMLMSASKNPDKLYTAVFDEMHKSNVIEMINDELLQAISTKRNRERRFISLDEDTAEIYQDSELDTERGNLLIPDNFGFIFISSKPRVISNNADFFNRVDIVLLKSYKEETIKTSEELLSNKLDNEEKVKFSSTRND